jgi:hypothetical protein
MPRPSTSLQLSLENTLSLLSHQMIANEDLIHSFEHYQGFAISGRVQGVNSIRAVYSPAKKAEPAIRQELDRLYRRRQAVDILIRSVEQYARLAGGPRACLSSARKKAQYERG